MSAWCGPHEREAVLDSSPLLNIVQCTHACLFVYICVQRFLGYYLFPAQPVGDGQQRGQRGMGRPPLCLFESSSVCGCIHTVCRVKAAENRFSRDCKEEQKSPACSCTVTNRGEIILKHEDAACKAKAFSPNFYRTGFIVSRDLI